MGIYGSPEFLDYVNNKPHICKKCGAEFKGKFCPECGTPARYKQFRWWIPYSIVFGIFLIASFSVQDQIRYILGCGLVIGFCAIALCIALWVTKLIIKHTSGLIYMPWLKNMAITSIIILIVSFTIGSAIKL